MDLNQWSITLQKLCKCPKTNPQQFISHLKGNPSTGIHMEDMGKTSYINTGNSSMPDFFTIKEKWNPVHGKILITRPSWSVTSWITQVLSPQLQKWVFWHMQVTVGVKYSAICLEGKDRTSYGCSVIWVTWNAVLLLSKTHLAVPAKTPIYEHADSKEASRSLRNSVYS